MAAYDPYQAYQQSRVETASQYQLVLMLYQGCVRRCQEAHAALERGDYAAARTSLLKAQDIVAELIATLNVEAGGELAQQLLSLYCFAHKRLIDANIQRKTEPLSEALGIMQGLLEAWEQMGAHQSGHRPNLSKTRV